MTAARIAALPCWSQPPQIVAVNDVDAEEMGLGSGRTNTNFIATTDDGQKHFVRVGKDLPAFGVTRAKEQAAAVAAASAGVGAAVLHAELPDILVTAFVDGRALTEEQMRSATASGGDSALLDALTAAIRTLHATPLPAELAELVPPGAPRWVPPDLPRWIAGARAGGFSRLPLLDDCDELIARAEAFIESGWTAKAPSFCHFDLLPDNFVVHRPSDGPIGVVIVDFEYTNGGQPLMDLAVLSMGCELSAEEERALLSSYLSRPVDDADAQRFLALKMLATLRETFWGVTAEVSGTSALSPEAAASYVDENYAKHVAARKAFEACLARRADTVDGAGHEYLAKHHVPEALRDAVATVLRERPADPIGAIAGLLMK